MACCLGCASGIQAAVRKHFTGTSWQRCNVHFMRNIMARVKHRDKIPFAGKLIYIWLQPDRKSAILIIEKYHLRMFLKESIRKYEDAAVLLVFSQVKSQIPVLSQVI
ncbi:MAG: transposase [Spirochaetales bacterium]|nr:transposase [Spirochaetales bacterium]